MLKGPVLHRAGVRQKVCNAAYRGGEEGSETGTSK